MSGELLGFDVFTFESFWKCKYCDYVITRKTKYGKTK